MCGSCFVAQKVKTLPVLLASYVDTSGVPTAPLPIQIPANVSGKATKDDPNIQIPATHLENPNVVSGSWIQSGPASQAWQLEPSQE